MAYESLKVFCLMTEHKQRFIDRVPNFIILLIILAGYMNPQLLMATDWPDVDIDLVTCQPDGIVASIRERWDPLGFWVEQNVKLETALETENLEHLIDLCRIEYSNDRKALLECISYVRSRHQAMVKCYKHTRKMCRHLGGNCK